MASILLSGIATLDIVSQVDHYPREDEEMRALQMERLVGGNAANTARVLAGLGHEPELLCNLATDQDGEWLAGQLQKEGLSLRHAPRLAGHTPTSCIILNRQNGSRTIVHYRDLPELSAEALRTIPLAGYDWLHFEGRNLKVTRACLQQIRDSGLMQPVSVEIEKDRPGIDCLFGLADVLLFSGSYLVSRGFAEAGELFAAIRPLAPGALLVCSRGEAGAWAQTADGAVLHAPAVVPDRIVDTRGAGDTFNAGLIHGLLEGPDLNLALQQACRLAGRKVGQYGFANLA